jgi:TetR/AcrR family tetracycline transcriptional repressor
MTRAAVLASARDMLAESGLDGLTMRALARRLNVAPNALYSHVADKTDLLDGVLDDLLAAVPESAPDIGDPSAQLVELLSSTFEVLTQHPRLVPLYLTRGGAQGPHALRLGRAMDTMLSRAGVHATEVADARRVLIIHTIGSAAFTVSSPAEAGGRRLSGQDARRLFDRSLRSLLAGITHDV